MGRLHSHDGNCCTGFGDPVFEPPKWWQFGRRLRRWWHARRVGKFNEFTFPLVNSTFPALDAEELVKVQPMVDRPPHQEKSSVFNGKVFLDGPAVGRLFAGYQAGHLRSIGVEVPEDVPDCASINEQGAFTWYKVEFTLPPTEETK